MLDSTADLVDAVLTTARVHLATEAEAAVKSRKLATDIADAEVSLYGMLR